MRRLLPTLLCVLLCARLAASTFAARKAASSSPSTYKDVAPFSSSAFPERDIAPQVYKDVALQISQDAFDSAGKVYFNAGVLSYASKLSVKGHYVNTSIFELLLPKAYALCPNWYEEILLVACPVIQVADKV